MCNCGLNLLLHDIVLNLLFRRNRICATSVLIHHIVVVMRFSRGNRKIQNKVCEDEEQQVYEASYNSNFCIFRAHVHFNSSSADHTLKMYHNPASSFILIFLIDGQFQGPVCSAPSTTLHLVLPVVAGKNLC